MPNPHPTPPPKGTSKFFLLAGVVVGLVVIVAFIGMNAQHAQDSKAQQSGQVKPSETPMHEKDLGKAPVQPK
ncbi:hypothetical protein [Tardiphaga sp.]|jgi:hypothetical protein|uniref:hypothetical protein n=1 Tax=Tardiphaga sp. TaxID=1926292 RepID=UPI0037DA003E